MFEMNSMINLLNRKYKNKFTLLVHKKYFIIILKRNMGKQDKNVTILEDIMLFIGAIT